MLFLDGVGIGRADPAVNPFFVARLPALQSLLGGSLPHSDFRYHTNGLLTFTALDSTLGVEGLPQSGTGQTALFTGVNASKLVGKHFGPHPYSTLKPLIQSKNIFRQVMDTGLPCSFANAFPQRFFDYLAHRRSRLTVTTLSCTMSGVPLLRAEHLEEGAAISADITNEGWHGLGYPHIKTIEAAEAGRRLVALTRRNAFVLFEYWRPDHAGHSQKMDEAVDVLEKFDAMLGGVIETLNTDDTLLMITSDHGNIEDMSTRTHTRNPVPLLLYGYRQGEFAASLGSLPGDQRDLTWVTPAVMRGLRGK
jgi:2,3-bisphosphoglycerate-independent phosphoglycerate mutase